VFSKGKGDKDVDAVQKDRWPPTIGQNWPDSSV